jgi:bifunctional enzyme CysN/CysC
MTLWLTGLPAAGKSTLADALAEVLSAEGRVAAIVDGDVLRAQHDCDLGFSRDDRAEQARRATVVALEHVAAGRVAVVALVSPYRSDRARAREAHDALGIGFAEVHVATPLSECEARDPKGLYRRARCGELTHLTGIDDPYEPPRDPDVRVTTLEGPPPELARIVLERVLSRVSG